MCKTEGKNVYLNTKFLIEETQSQLKCHKVTIFNVN